MNTIQGIESAERHNLRGKKKHRKYLFGLFLNICHFQILLRNGFPAGLASRQAINYVIPEIPFSEP